MLIAGCSHSAGSEIDGTEDSIYNREHSYGSHLAKLLGYHPLNISISGASNSTISRSILEWVNVHYTKDTELFVLVSWTESSRIEVPAEFNFNYKSGNSSISWFSKTSNQYHRINQGWEGFTLEEKRFIRPYHQFIANNLEYLEIISANYVLQLQYFFQSKNIKYLMCNTMHMFSNCRQLDFYLNLIDDNNYINIRNNEESFYWKYKNLGYTNPKAKYWHHDEKPHLMYCKELYKFIKQKGIL
jgi:hypothetical protein